MTKMLYALMDSTDHLMENGTPQKSGSQPDLVVISDSKALI
jgi:hypothetical protein